MLLLASTMSMFDRMVRKNGQLSCISCSVAMPSPGRAAVHALIGDEEAAHAGFCRAANVLRADLHVGRAREIGVHRPRDDVKLLDRGVAHAALGLVHHALEGEVVGRLAPARLGVVGGEPGAVAVEVHENPEQVVALVEHLGGDEPDRPEGHVPAREHPLRVEEARELLPVEPAVAVADELDREREHARRVGMPAHEINSVVDTVVIRADPSKVVKAADEMYQQVNNVTR